GRGGLRRDARGQGRLPALRRPRDRARRRHRGGTPRPAARRGRAAVACLRLLRPVRLFRGTRRAVPQGRRGNSRRAQRAAAGSHGRSDMTPTAGRGDTSLVGRWWWTIDRWSLVALLALMAFGAVLIVAASPAVSERIGLDTFSLAKRQLVLQP